MVITLITVGHKQPSWVGDAVYEYKKRFGREILFQLKEIKPEKRTQSNTTEQILTTESYKIKEHIPQYSFLVILDEKGKNLTSIELSQQLKLWMLDSINPCFIIGGADGISPQLKKESNLMLQLSQFTLPHGLARVILIEQLYRAYSILNNHPYHRA